MATYIQGLTDYIPQIQPFQPDLNFYGNVMQTRQGRYDSAKKKVSDLYGSLLNSPMSRDSNIKRREEFFKVVDNDIKRISGLDLSLQQNQDQAMNVFKGFYEDKNMINDMVKTKKGYAEMERGNNFKYCTDKEKCGGQYWEPGMQKLQYKMEEFKNVSDEEAMNYQIGEFDPYFDWKKEAGKKAKEMGYEVTQSASDGKWMIKDSNGKLVQKPLYDFFKSLYGDDPRVQSNYDTQAFVTRKNFARGNALQFGSEEEAEKHYIMKNINEGLGVAQKNLKEINESYGQVNSTFLKLDRKVKTGADLTPQERQVYELASQQRGELDASKTSIQSRIDDIQNNIDMKDINSLRRRADLSAATSFEQSDMVGLATSLADIKKGHDITGADPYAKMYAEFGLQKKLADHNALLDVWKMKQEYGLKLNLQEAKNAKKTGQLADTTGTEGYAIEGVSWSNIKYDLDEKPSLMFDQQIADRNSKAAVASTKSTAALFQLYQTAKNAVKLNPAENDGAKQFLSQFENPKVGDIDSVEKLQQAIIANKHTPISLFNGLASQASIKKNPTGDYSWARPILNQKGGVIDDVKFANDAYHASLNSQLKTNKRIAAAVAGTMSPENAVARHADLLVSNMGFLESEDKFIKKYIAAKEERNIIATTDQAKDAYKALTKQFFTTYNSAAETSLRQGQGLSGEGMESATPVQFTGLDLLDKGSNKVVTDIIKTVNTAITNPATTVVAIGDASAETLKEGNNEGLADFLTFYLNQADLTDKSKNRSFSAVVSNIAAEDPTKSSITFKGIDPDVVKQYEGSAKNKKVLFGEDISKGITVFFDKTKQASPFIKPIGNLETLLKLDGHAKSTGFEDLAGTVDYSFDANTNKVRAEWHPAGYKDGKWIEAAQPPQEGIIETDIANIDKLQATMNAKLQAQALINQQAGEKLRGKPRG